MIRALRFKFICCCTAVSGKMGCLKDEFVWMKKASDKIISAKQHKQVHRNNSLRSHPHTPGRYPGCFTNSLSRNSFLCGGLGKFGVSSQGKWAKSLKLLQPCNPAGLRGCRFLSSKKQKKRKPKPQMIPITDPFGPNQQP